MFDEYEESAESILEDLYQVGKTKSLGYLPIETLSKYCNKTVGEIIEFAIENGLEFMLYEEGVSKVYSGMIAVYHEKMLSDILGKYESVLNKANVPTRSTREYIDYTSKITVHQEVFPEAYIAIGKTFNDHRFRDIEIK